MKTLFAFTLLAFIAGSAAKAQDLVKVFPNNTKVVLENDRIRIIEVLAKAGDKVPTHSHPAHVLYSISGGKLRTTVGDNKPVETELKAGDARWFEPVTHSNEALTDGKLLVIELKEPAKVEMKMEKK